MALLASLIGLITTVLSSWVGRALIALGLSYVTYTGFDAGITWLLNQIKDSIGSMGADTVSFLGFMWVDKSIGMLFSAYSAALLVKMGGSSTFTKLTRK